jgi:autotransporter-associated beta strand protein
MALAQRQSGRPRSGAFFVPPFHRLLKREFVRCAKSLSEATWYPLTLRAFNVPTYSLEIKKSSRIANPWAGKLTLWLCLIVSAFLLASDRVSAQDFSWRDVGGMDFATPVKYQDHTGMCWAFSSVAALESMYKITRNDPTYNSDLSEQQLPCAGVGDAVIGGFPSSALAYFQLAGVVTEAELPFTKSNYSPLWPLSAGWRDRAYKIDSQSGFTGNAATIKDYVKRYGPIITEMQIDNDWYGPEQGPSRGGHAVLITGYHDDAALPGGGYFIVKNSWGDWWGDGGYGKIPYSAFGTYSQWMITGPAYAVGAAHTLAWDTSPDPGAQSGAGTWSLNADNWTPNGQSRGVWVNGEDAAVFAPSTGNQSITVDGALSLHAITFENGLGRYSLSGGSLTITHGGIAAGTNVAIASEITVGAPQQWTVAAGKTLSISGPVNTHISPLTISGDGNTLIKGVIRDVHADPRYDGLLSAFKGSLIKTGAGTLTLAAANVYTGNTTVSGGTLTLSGSQGAILASPVYITGGKLLIDNTLDNVAHRIASSAGVMLQGGELALRGHPAGTSENIDNLMLHSGNSTITAAAATNVSAIAAPYLGRNLGATALVRGTNLGAASSGAVGQIRFSTAPLLSNSGSGDQTGIVPYLIGDNNIDGPGTDLVTYGANGLRPLIAGEYAYSLLLAKNVRLSASANTGALSIRSLVLENSGAPSQVTIENGSTLAITSGAVLSIGSAANIISGGAITFGNNSAAGYEGIIHAVSDMTIQSSIVNNGTMPVNLTKAGPGTLILAANNTFSGRTYISGGILQIGDGGTTGSLPGAVTNNAELVFQRSDNVTFSGAISGNGHVTKLGDNTLILTGYNNYTGGTTIASGALQIGNGISGGYITGNISNNAQLIFNRSGSMIFNGVISGDGSLIKLGPGNISINAPNTYSGSTIINNGKLTLLSTGSLASGLIDVHAGAFDVSSVIGYTLDAGKMIAGNGTVAGAVTVRGTVAPGESCGTLTVNDMTFADGSLLDIQLGGAQPGSLYDVLSSTGTIALQPGSRMKLSFVDGFEPMAGTAFDILDFSSLTGSFSTLDLPVLSGGRWWNTGNLYLNGTISVVPEPAAYIMLLVLLTGVFMRKMLRR